MTLNPQAIEYARAVYDHICNPGMGQPEPARYNVSPELALAIDSEVRRQYEINLIKTAQEAARRLSA